MNAAPPLCALSFSSLLGPFAPAFPKKASTHPPEGRRQSCVCPMQAAIWSYGRSHNAVHLHARSGQGHHHAGLDYHVGRASPLVACS